MRKVVLTLKFEDDGEVYRFENWLKQYIEIVDLKLLSDTSELYEKDDTFKELTLEYKRIKKLRNDYINDYLYKK